MNRLIFCFFNDSSSVPRVSGDEPAQQENVPGVFSESYIGINQAVEALCALGRRFLEKVFESLGGNIGGVENLFERTGFDDVMSGDDDDMFLVGHRDMFAFAEDIEACPLEGSHDTFMRDLRQLAHAPTSTVLNFFSRFNSSMLSR